jgi:trehalose synthase
LDKYKYYVFSLPDYVAPNIDPDKVCIIHPAIDPLTEKNKPMPEKKAKKIIADHGIDAAKPLICQISRFDPWKDPVGVIKAYKIAKKSFPDLQLALMGLIVAKDDPEAVEMHKKVKKAKANDPDIHIFADPAKINVSNNQMVSALQTASDIVIQKSIREGFGLTVTEAMWKSKPVIAGNVGGIKIQIDHKISGFLVNNIEETAKYIEKLLENPELGKKMGKAAKDTVRKKFLITRLLLDWLKVLDNIN